MGHAGTIDAPLAFKMEHTLIFWSFLTLLVFSSWAFERGTPNRPHVLYNGKPAINTVHRLIGPRERQCNDAQPVFQKSSFICHLTPATNTSDSSAGPARLASQAHHQFINHPGLIPPSIHLFMWPAFHTFYHKLLLHNNHNPAVFSLERIGYCGDSTGNKKKEQKIYWKVTRRDWLTDLPIPWLHHFLEVRVSVLHLIFDITSHHRPELSNPPHSRSNNRFPSPAHSYPVSLSEHVRCIKSPTGRSDIPIWTLAGTHTAPTNQGHPARTHQLKPKTCLFSLFSVLTSAWSMWTPQLWQDFIALLLNWTSRGEAIWYLCRVININSGSCDGLKLFKNAQWYLLDLVGTCACQGKVYGDASYHHIHWINKFIWKCMKKSSEFKNIWCGSSIIDNIYIYYIYFKAAVHPKRKILSSYTHPQVPPDLY